MFHFRENPTCSIRTSDNNDIVSVAPDIATFQDCQSTNPRYCAECAGIIRSDSDRYSELRKLVESWQSHTVGSSQTLAEWSHR